MVAVDALVAEVPRDFVDALQPADDQPLEVELRRDAQIQVAVQRVVMRHEGARGGAAVQRLQDWRLDLDEAVAVEELAHRGEHAGAREEDRELHIAVGDQVQIALAVACLRIEELEVAARALGWQRAQRLGQQLVVIHAHRLLAGLRREERAAGLQKVAEIEQPDAPEGFLADVVQFEVQLNPACGVFNAREDRLAHVV